MPEQDDGQVGHPVVSALDEHVDVVDQAVPARGAEHAERVLRRRGGAMAAVVLALDEKARAREPRGEVAATRQMLAMPWVSWTTPRGGPAGSHR